MPVLKDRLCLEEETAIFHQLAFAFIINLPGAPQYTPINKPDPVPHNIHPMPQMFLVKRADEVTSALRMMCPTPNILRSRVRIWITGLVNKYFFMCRPKILQMHLCRSCRVNKSIGKEKWIAISSGVITEKAAACFWCLCFCESSNMTESKGQMMLVTSIWPARNIKIIDPASINFFYFFKYYLF